MPYTNNNLVASGAADKKVQLHDVSQKKTITSFSNHLNRVKRLDVAQDCPNLIWSASEDGTVMETDIRAPPLETNVLVNLNSILGKQAEAKCISVNQTKLHSSQDSSSQSIPLSFPPSLLTIFRSNSHSTRRINFFLDEILIQKYLEDREVERPVL